MVINELKASFIKSISEQASLYEKLKSVVLEENRALNEKNVKAIEKAIAAEEELVAKIQKAEAQKKELFDKMARAAGFNAADGLKLQEVLEKMEKQPAEEITTSVTQLLKIAGEVEEVNSKNSHLLKNFVDYVDFVGKFKSAAEKKAGDTYTPDGYMKKTPPVKKSNFDSKI